MNLIQKGKRFFSQHKYKILAGVSFALAGYAFYQYATDQSRIKLSAFLQALQNKQLDQVVLRGKTIFFKSQLSDWYYTFIGNYPFSQMFNLLKSSENVSFSCEEQQNIMQVLPILIGAAGITFLTLKTLVPQSLGKFNKQAQLVHNNQKFDHFYGNQQIKAKLKELVDYIKDQSKYQKLGGRIRKGILLYGPPGTGKTMLAKTLANQAQISFIQTCASEFQQIYVGVGPKKIRDLFQRARACKEGCIIFIDQLDAIGSRSEGMRFSRQTTATINQLLSQLDGFEANKNIFVIASTNRLDLVDSALIRAGRFDVKIKLNLPNKEQRKGILKVLLRKKQVPHQISEQAYDKISQLTQNWSGADFQTLINEGIYKAVRKNLPTLQTSELLQALNQQTYNDS